MNDLEQQVEELTRQLHELKTLQAELDLQLQLVDKRLQLLHSEMHFEIRPLPVQQPEPEPEKLHNIPIKNEPRVTQRRQRAKLEINSQVEDFIGTNVISKIGILVTVIGVFIGAKYAIDKDLISPAVRIIAGYFAALALAMVALRLKSKYKYFSSILIGGGLAVAYFITYIAYGFYSFYSPALAFSAMVITTVAAAAIALWYDQKVIALFGQVGAYAIPFLLSNGGGNIFILFGYITLINLGLLILSFYKDWKPLYHVAFFVSWFIYFFTTVFAEKVNNFSAGITYLTLNFLTFYATFLSYKVFKRQLFQLAEIGILLLNTLIFFLLGSYLIADHFKNIHILTWFTAANACLHFAVGLWVYRLRLADPSVFQFILGFALLFVTIAIPIELDANWVTVLWIAEATILAYVAKQSRRHLYLEIAFPLIIISGISLLQDWGQHYPFIGGQAFGGDYSRAPFLNTNFTLSLLVCICLALIVTWVINIDQSNRRFIKSFYTSVLPPAFLAILYFTIYNEIHFGWDKVISHVSSQTPIYFRSLSLIVYSCIFFALSLYVNSRLAKRPGLHRLFMVFAFATNFVFLFQGLNAIGELRDHYLQHHNKVPVALYLLRYLSALALGALWLSVVYASRTFTPSKILQLRISIMFNLTLLSIISNEFIHWMNIAGYQNQYKLGLSLIWGVYALALLFIGMEKKKKHLRISAIVLFAVTLLKLFFYDLSSLSTISKTVVLVLLGILLLSASFLYNKYKDLLLEKDEDDFK